MILSNNDRLKTANLLNVGLLDYEKAWQLQRKIHQKRVSGESPDTLIFCEHPHTYTIGKTGYDAHLLADENTLARQGVQVHRIDRGGDITYHGPGQIVGYSILDLHDHYLDVHRYLRDIEQVIINTLAEYDIRAERDESYTGVWVNGEKIAAIGVKVSRWVTMHGFAFNVNVDLSYFNNIVPCGISDKAVTSLGSLKRQKMDMREVVGKVADNFSDTFGLNFEKRDE